MKIGVGVKILHVTTHMNTGGIAQYILSVASALKDRGVDCIVASSGGDMVEELQRRGIVHRSLDIRTKSEFGPKVLKSIFQIYRIIKDEGVDIVHGHTRVSQVSGLIASRMAGALYVSTCHGFFKKRLGRRIFDLWGDRVIAISGPVRESLIRDFKVSPERIELIYSGVDVRRFSKDRSNAEISDFKHKLGLGDEPIVGTIGRLSSVKGHIFFIEAMKGISSEGRRIKGIIVGSGPEEGSLKRLVKDLGMEDSFFFFESTADTPRYLDIMDIFVFPSVKEGLGLSLLEAMAQGRPSIASNIGGIRDIIKDGETGILFNAGDAGMLKRSIIRLLDDAGLRARLGQAARRLVRERFSLDIMTDKITSLYKNMLRNYADK